jgi:hypothetical protein
MLEEERIAMTHKIRPDEDIRMSISDRRGKIIYGTYLTGDETEKLIRRIERSDYDRDISETDAILSILKINPSEDYQIEISDDQRGIIKKFVLKGRWVVELICTIVKNRSSKGC